LRARTFVAAALTAVLVSGFLLTAPAGALLLLTCLEFAGGSSSGAEIRTAQAIVLLGGRTARVHDAARLAAATQLPLLISGKGTGDSGFRAESEKMAQILRTQYRMQPRWLETESIDTLENARFSRCLLGPERVRRVALITDPDHMLRARMAFRAVGFEVLPVPAPFRQAVTWTSRDLLPSTKVQPLATRALLEWGGAVAMLWAGWFSASPDHECPQPPATPAAWDERGKRSELREFQGADRDEAAHAGQQQQPRTGTRIEMGEQQHGGQPARKFAVAAFAGRVHPATRQGGAVGREWELHGLVGCWRLDPQ
jgi:uncharacterized SAM-binding protein YcdF (DUF218 family)